MFQEKTWKPRFDWQCTNQTILPTLKMKTLYLKFTRSQFKHVGISGKMTSKTLLCLPVNRLVIKLSSVHDSDDLKWLILRQTKNIKTVELINQTSWLSPIPCCLQSVLLDTEIVFLETGGNLSSLRNAHDWLPPGESCTSLVWYWDWATNFLSFWFSFFLRSCLV